MPEFEQKLGSPDLVQDYRDQASENLESLHTLFEDYFGENGRGHSLPEPHQNTVRGHAEIYTFMWSKPERVKLALTVRNPELEGQVRELGEELNVETWEKVREDFHNLQLDGQKGAGLDSRAHHLAKKAIAQE